MLNDSRRTGLLSRLLMAAAAIGTGVGATPNTPSHTGRKSVLGALTQGVSKTHRSRGHRYPEQSSRQAMRGHRRAQGGPGIELDTRTGKYHPRSA